MPNAIGLKKQTKLQITSRKRGDSPVRWMTGLSRCVEDGSAHDDGQLVEKWIGGIESSLVLESLRCAQNGLGGFAPRIFVHRGEFEQYC
jgi:hypothetical protein